MEEQDVEKSSESENVEITQQDLDDLASLLASFKNVIIAHEQRLLEHEGRLTTLEGQKPIVLKR